MLVLWRKEPQNQICHSIKLSQLQSLCWELQDRIETLENALKHSIKAAENRKRKQMVKIKRTNKSDGQSGHNKNVAPSR